jgi:hypothetical protein
MKKRGKAPKKKRGGEEIREKNKEKKGEGRIRK